MVEKTDQTPTPICSNDRSTCVHVRMLALSVRSDRRPSNRRSHSRWYDDVSARYQQRPISSRGSPSPIFSFQVHGCPTTIGNAIKPSIGIDSGWYSSPFDNPSSGANASSIRRDETRPSQHHACHRQPYIHNGYRPSSGSPGPISSIARHLVEFSPVR